MKAASTGSPWQTSGRDGVWVGSLDGCDFSAHIRLALPTVREHNFLLSLF